MGSAHPTLFTGRNMTSSNNLSVNPQHLLALFCNRNYHQLSEVFISVLEHFQDNIYLSIDANLQQWIDNFVSHFLFLFTQVDYTPSEPHALKFIELNPTIANLVAISNFKTTDAYLEILRNQSNSLVKLLALYSARNTVKIDRRLLFDANPQLACLWYSYFYGIYASALVNKEVYHNLREHLAYNDERLKKLHNFAGIFFGATYIDGCRDRQLKQKINSLTKKTFSPAISIKNTPDPKKIAVLSAVWYSTHSAYRILSEFVDALKDDYSLTLVKLGENPELIETDSFHDVRHVFIDPKTGDFNLDAIKSNDFSVVYYPDIGMSIESILLSNLRIAPIQVGSLGHSVSTFGSEIDYFISGADVEISSGAELNYSERLVLLPGMGSINNYPTYNINKGRKRGFSKQKNRDKFIIGCSWSAQKINYPLVCLLAEILQKSKQQIVFRLFCGGSQAVWSANGFILFVRELEARLGKKNFDIVLGKPYDEYMALMESVDICIDSYHFGGCNTVVDSLYLRKLIVTFECDRWYNRIGSQMLREVGLAELIATNEQEYINVVLKLIHDERYRLKLERQLKKADLEQTIFNSSSKIYFKKAIDFLIENHSQLKAENSNQPILIQ